MSYLHGNNIIHRDLKPANILISFDGTLKVCDLDRAGDLDRTREEGQIMSQQGAYRYMAPEAMIPNKLCNEKREMMNLKEEQWQKISQNDVDMNNVDVQAEIKAAYYATKLEE
uniref:Protein kinase domain-containing protein n=1 Tax=Acrobeloides nanus TaxID=290746 RepID=A0A914CFF9_9BILA